MKKQKRTNVIKMNVSDDSGFLSVYSTGENPALSSEVAQFLDESVMSVRAKDEIKLEIYSSCIDSDEKRLYVSAIKDYFKKRKENALKSLKRNYILSGIFLFFGVIILAIALILEYKTQNILWSEVVDVAAWVFLWEAVNIYAIENHGLRLQWRRYSSLSEISVEFFNTEK